LGRPSAVRVSLVLTAGIVAVSCGSLLVRMASPSVPALAIAAYRMTAAILILLPFLARGRAAHELAGALRRDWPRFGLAGTALAFHFAFWIASLSYTSVASSVLLVDTTPFFIGLATTFLMRQRSPGAFWAGLAIAFTGCVVVFHGDWQMSATSLKGNLLAVGGAVAMAVYLMAGARLRAGLSLVAFVWPVYAFAAAVLAAACLAGGVQMRGFPPDVWFYLFLLGLVPQCIGHTSFNWSLRWLSPGMVALIVLAEPVGASVLAWIFLHEALTPAKVAGGAVILLGIYVATRGSRNDGAAAS
jgi:drug/metabolite transporter (DMT)-like permease